MKRIKNMMFLFFVFIITAGFSPQKAPKRVLTDEVYSGLLSSNLIHAMQSAKVLYHLSKEDSFDKSVLETSLDRIEANVHYGNAQISKMVEHASKADKIKVSGYLKSIDKHLAAVFVDIKSIRKDLEKKENIAPLLSDIYYQLKNAEYQDHKEIKQILKFRIYNEPVIVKQ